MDDAVWNHAVFSKNRDRLLSSEVAQRFFAEVNEQAKKFMSDEHFTVDRTLIQAWASQKSFRPKGGSGDGDGENFHGQKRSNKTHASRTDPDARLYKKSYGKESKLSYLGHALVENRNGLIATAMVTHADGYAERDAALLMLAEKQQDRARRITVGADKAYDTEDFVRTVRELNVTPHISAEKSAFRPTAAYSRSNTSAMTACCPRKPFKKLTFPFRSTRNGLLLFGSKIRRSRHCAVYCCCFNFSPLAFQVVTSATMWPLA
jgi:hypothetical protein